LKGWTVKKKWLFGGLVLGGVLGTIFARKKMSSGYDDDDIDEAGSGEFGYRAPDAPAQQAAPAETRTDVTVEELSMAARIGASAQAIREAWPSLSEDEINATEGDLDSLTGRIAERTEQSREEVRRRLDEILARETPRPSYPAH
jgi:uncharacterized protein YjbJ (UPF0337 family)